MAFIEWDGDRFGVGVERFDEQHRRLFELTDDLHGAMREGEGREEVGRVLAELEEYTYHHFDDEEGFMEDCGYADHCPGCFSSHEDAHRAFEQRVSELRADHEAGDLTVSMETLRFLRDWLQSHVASADQDQDYSDYYAGDRGDG